MVSRVLPFGTALLAASVLLLPAAAQATPGAGRAAVVAVRPLSQDVRPERPPTAARLGLAPRGTSLALPAPKLTLRRPVLAIPARPVAPRPSRAQWSAPVADAPISQPFGRPDPGYAAGYHTGVDFAVPVGTPVLAVADATVRTAGPGGAYGNEVKLNLPDGRIALYAHLSRIRVSAGEAVTAGQRVGASGDTGNSTGPHLHFEIRTADAYGAVIDPLPYLLAHGAVLGGGAGNEKAPGE